MAHGISVKALTVVSKWHEAAFLSPRKRAINTTHGYVRGIPELVRMLDCFRSGGDQ